MSFKVQNISIFLSPITLALISLTNLINNKEFKILIVILFLLSLSLVTLKILNIAFKKESLENYELALIPTFCMAMMMFSNILILINYTLANIIWTIFFMGHLLIIILFTRYKFYTVKNNFIPGYMIIYVGILSASISGAVFNHQIITNFILLIGIMGLIYLIPKLIYFCINNSDVYLIPYKMICLAPFSLFYLGLKSNYQINTMFLNFVIFLVFLSTIYGFYLMINLRKEKLNITFAAFSFPIVINTIALDSFIEDLNSIFLSDIFLFYKEIIIFFILILSVYFIYLNLKNLLYKSKKKSTLLF